MPKYRYVIRRLLMIFGFTITFGLTACGGGEESTETPLPEPPPTSLPQLTIADMSGPEHATEFSFLVSLSAPSTNTVTVEYETLDGSATHSEDYEETSGRLSFIPGETQQTIQVGIVNDSETESSEKFHLLLNEPVHSTLADDTGKVDRFKTMYAENPPTVETLAKVADGTN